MAAIFDAWALAVFWIIALCVFIALVTIPFNHWKKRGIVVVALFCIVVTSFLSLFLLEYLIKNEVSELINENSFVIESYEGFDNTMLLKALKNKQYVSTHKTRSLEKRSIRVVVRSGEFELQVAQDSKNPYLYWIYYPKYRYSRENELGKVRIKKYE
ncbi:hypothetical protein [Photobacterium sp.]|uniref:hypothetical protein n=1 Tax=Photobacterium sp. TaxID=660 RepID=UPI00299CEDFA|nr:hypothetical protein [Photobacterium sp.]MDX1302778.1 hypothetical protein [Photobacterium sp.]